MVTLFHVETPRMTTNEKNGTKAKRKKFEKKAPQDNVGT